MSDPIERLSEGQKKCLRLVAEGMTSKEIAQQTGFTWETVDTCLKRAMARLGTDNRRVAARMLRDWELSQKSGSLSPALAESLAAGEPLLVTGKGEGRSWWRLPPVGGGFNDLNWGDKTFAALRVAAVGAATILALSLAIAGLYKILT